MARRSRVERARAVLGPLRRLNFLDGTYVAQPADACVTIFDCPN